MTDDEIINKVLDRYDEFGGHGFYERCDLAVGKEVPFNKAKDILELMLHYNLIEEIENPWYKVSGQGLVIRNQGGWLNKLKADDKQQKRSERNQNIDLVIKIALAIMTLLSGTLGYKQYKSDSKVQKLEVQNLQMTHEIESLKTINQELLQQTSDRNLLIDSLTKN